MFLFLKLVLAHLIADFILQFKELFELKLRSLWGHFLHAACHGVVTLVLLLPYWNQPFVWIFVPAIAAIHFFQDLLKYRYMDNDRWFFVIFVADQVGHIGFLATILLFPISSMIVGFPEHPLLNHFYTDNQWTLYLIAFILIAFSGNFLFNAFARSFYNDGRRGRFISNYEMIHGMIERAVITGIFLFGSHPALMVLSPAAGAPRLLLPPVRDVKDFLLSYIFAAGTGLFFRFWI